MTQTYTPPAPATSATFGSLRRRLLAGWAAFTLAAVAFVGLAGTNAPYADEWEFVPVLVGHEPPVPWLWRQHNEHRFPLPRLIYLGLFALTHDFRAGMLLQVAMLAALALYLMRLADRLRGRPSGADLFFPVSLLHIGHWENFVMGYQICFALFAVLATALAVVALRTTRENSFRSGLAAGVLLVLLSLTGGSGLAVTVPVSGWIAFLAVGVWRSGGKGRGLLLFVFAVVPLAYLGAYFVDYRKPPGHPDLSTDPVRVVGVTAQVLAVSFGMGLSAVWWLVCPGLVAVGGGTVARLIRRANREPGEWPATAGLVAVAAGVTGVAVAIGMGRAGLSADAGLWSRYSLLTWPLLAATYLVWVRADRRWVPILLCATAALALPGNLAVGAICGAAVKSEYSAVEADNAAGLSPEQIVAAEGARADARQHGGVGGVIAVVLQTVDERSVRAIPMLRAARIGIFGK
jgi:hypothetical protein